MDDDPKPIVSDGEIAALLAVGKPLPDGWMDALTLKPTKHGHKGAELDVTGDDGSLFQIRIRQSTFDPLAFSAILFVLDSHGLRRFCLRRYNGRSHGHRNVIEGGRLSIGFHIHYATERYQAAGFSEDAFAEATDRYSNIGQAIECLLRDCGFRDDSPAQRLPF
jgi:hypothetical protein